MSQIGSLIQQHCPNGVQHLPLGEVGEFVRGSGMQKVDLTDSGIPAIHYGQIHTHYGVWSSATLSFVSPDLATRLRMAKPGDLVIATTSEDDEAVGKASAWLGEEPAAVSGDAFIFSHTLDPKFVSYFFQGTDFQAQKRRYITGAKVRRISGTNLAKIKIPVPPTEVQQAIVRILDRFAQLETALEAELEARQKQYEHYSNYLTHPFESGREVRSDWVEVRMGELCRIEKGETPIQKAEPGQYPLITTGTEHRTSSEFQFDAEAACVPLISSRGHGVASLARVYFQAGKFALGNILAAAIPHDDSGLSAEFLHHYLHARKDIILVPLMRGGANVSLTIDSLKRVKIHVPPAEVQEQIVASLRSLDQLVSDPLIGLPAEIRTRRSQYAHYRDKLLTFKELVV